MKVIKKDNKEIFYKVIEKNTKHSYIKVDNGFLVITKSKRMNIEFILNNVYDKFDYYYDVTKKTEDDTFFLWGKKYKLRVNESNSFNYQIEEEIIKVNSNITNYQEVKKQILSLELKNYLKENELNISRHITNNGYYLVPIKLKYLKSKYGSYNYNKKNEYIVLNTFLATLEEKYLLYVLYHEYAHQKVKNHQKEFYDALKLLLPEHKTLQKQLKNFKLII